MILSTKVKKFSWVIPLFIFFAILVYKVITDGKGILISPLAIGIFIAIFQLLYNNVEVIRIPIKYLYYVFFRIQFELEINANISGDKESIEKISPQYLKDLISTIYRSDKFEKRIKEIHINRPNKAGVQYEVYLAPYGLNLRIELDHGDTDSIIRIGIESQKKYRQIKKMYENFLKVFFNEIESAIKEKERVKYSIRIFPESKEKNFFETQYLKNISDVDHFSIDKKIQDMTFQINSSYISINSKYQEDILKNMSKVMLRIK